VRVKRSYGNVLRAILVSACAMSSVAQNAATADLTLARAALRGGHPAEAEAEYRKAIALEPANFEANRELAGLYLHTNRMQEAVPLLKRAQQIRPTDYDNRYDLAQVDLLTGQAEEGRKLVAAMLAEKPTAELHALAGRIAERQARYVDAVQEFEAAAHQDPSEDNIFVWGSDLLAHRTYVPAIEVFRAGSERYPASARLLVGLGMALYAHGDSEPSVQSLLKAADADPSDGRTYLYLSKAYLSSPGNAEAVIECFRKYAELEPQNGVAQYYYAMSLWKARRLESASPDYTKIEALLRRSVELDDRLAESHLQLGILYSDQHAYDKARVQYERALQLAPQMPEAHFRMGRYYLQAGDKQKADGEFALFKNLQEQRHQAEDKAKAEVQQFVITEPAVVPAHP